MLTRPVPVDVINAYHLHLARTGRHSATCRELADAKGCAIMDVSAALNKAAERGALIKEGGTFRPAVSRIGTSMHNALALEKKASEKPRTKDALFVERYEQALTSPAGVKVALETEFGRLYGWIRQEATEVYARCGRVKPSAQGKRPVNPDTDTHKRKG